MMRQSWHGECDAGKRQSLTGDIRSSRLLVKAMTQPQRYGVSYSRKWHGAVTTIDCLKKMTTDETVCGCRLPEKFSEFLSPRIVEIKNGRACLMEKKESAFEREKPVLHEFR